MDSIAMLTVATFSTSDSLSKIAIFAPRRSLNPRLQLQPFNILDAISSSKPEISLPAIQAVAEREKEQPQKKAGGEH
jgi:hypothetical protein